MLNDLELAGQAILVKVGKKEQPSLEAFLSPKDGEAAKQHQALLDSFKAKVGPLLVRFRRVCAKTRLLAETGKGVFCLGFFKHFTLQCDFTGQFRAGRCRCSVQGW